MCRRNISVYNFFSVVIEVYMDKKPLNAQNMFELILSLTLWGSALFWIVILFCVLGPLYVWITGESDFTLESPTRHNSADIYQLRRNRICNSVSDSVSVKLND